MEPETNLPSNNTNLSDSEYLDQVSNDNYYDDDYDHDDMFDTDSALGSCGWGTDEWYE